ncbi:phosphoesterase [Spirochaetia bacterium]|nr:phosphoesterase [Spirochaetia bacterium]
MLIDFHTHLHLYKNISSMIDCIKNYNILSVACSVDIDSYKKTKEIDCPGLIVPTFGIHPMKSNTINDPGELDQYLDESKIIGEIGLDNYWVKDIDTSIQERVFKYIVDYCEKNGKYCVIHTKGMEEKIYEMISKYKNIKPIIHWYSGSIDIFKKLIDRKYYFTFGCEVYYSEYIRKLLSLTPLELILSETDNPESEIWLGGNTDSPVLIQRIVRDIAKVKKRDAKEMEHIIQENSKKIFIESDIN